MLNKATLIGYLGQDPECRTLENGVFVAQFSLATTDSWKDQNGEWQNSVEWHKVVAWRNFGEYAAKNLRKGSLVYVEGKIQRGKYTDKEGQERDSLSIVASTLRLLEKKDAF